MNRTAFITVFGLILAAGVRADDVRPSDVYGDAQAFTLSVSRPGVTQDNITHIYLMAKEGAALPAGAAHTCLVEYNRLGDSFRLINDAGDNWLGPIPRGSGVLKNSTCEIQGAGASSSVVSGTQVNVTFPIRFFPAKTTVASLNFFSLILTKTPVAQSSWQLATGTFVLLPAQDPYPDPAGPGVVSISSQSGTAQGGRFTAEFVHGGGVGQLYLGYMLFLPLPNVVQYTAKGSCLIEYNRISSGMRLINDAGDNWLGPIEGVHIGPGGGTLSNNLCTVDVASATAELSGNRMRVSVSVTFRSPGSVSYGTFLQAADIHDNWTGMTQIGNWNAPGNGTLDAATQPGPYLVSQTVGTGIDFLTQQKVYSVEPVVSDRVNLFATDPSLIDTIHVRLGNRITDPVACHLIYFAQARTFNLVNDAGTALVGATNLPAGVQKLQNSRCSAQLVSDEKTAAGVYLHVIFGFNATTFGGQKYLFTNAFDTRGKLTHWIGRPEYFVK